jgi:hypothetical protein
MKKIILIALILCLGTAFAENPDTLGIVSTINRVTVFCKGAQVTRSAKIRLQKGKALLVMGGLPATAVSSSFQVKGIPNCNTLSVKHQMTEPKFKNIEALQKPYQAKIKEIDLAMKEINNKISVFDQEQTLIGANSHLGSETKGVSVAEIREAADFFRLRLNEIKAARLKLETELESYSAKRQELVTAKGKLGQEEKKSYSELLVVVDCEKSTDSIVEFSYYVANAGWEPLYDFRVDNISKPLLIDFNANVFQSSGEEWKNVKLMLSTADPSVSGKLPVMKPWYLGMVASPSPAPSYSESIEGSSGAIRGTIRDKSTKEPVPFCNIVLEQNGIMKLGTTSDLDGNYSLRPVDAGKYDIKVSFVGYKPVKIVSFPVRSGIIELQNIELEATSVMLESVVVTNYKVPLVSQDRGSSGANVKSEELTRSSASTVAGVNGRVRGKLLSENQEYDEEVPVQQEVLTNYFSASLRTSVTNLVYQIDKSYTVPEDGDDYLVKIKQSSVPVAYEYHAIPRMDNDVFLTALVPDWASLNLLPGKVNLYYEGTFSGNSRVDSDLTSDTLVLSLGRDNNITVTREGNKEKYDKRVIGSQVREDIGWNITVKNNQMIPVKLLVEDQYPISVRKSIEVEPPKVGDASVNPDTGNLRWSLNLAPGEKKVLSYDYSVRYPKYEHIEVN